MVCRGEVPFASGLEILTGAAEQLADVLDDAVLAVDEPEYWGPDWFEVCRGNPLLPVHVLVDYVGNVLHVRRHAETFAAERFTLTYLPSWFFAVLDAVPARAVARLRDGRVAETVTAEVVDRDLAVPLRIDVAVERRTGRQPVAEPLVVYDLRPARGSMALREGADPAAVAQRADTDEAWDDVDRVHWVAPSVRISAAPGVSVRPRPLFPVVDLDDPWGLDLSGGVATLRSSSLWGWFVMNAAQCADDRARSALRPVAGSQQALEVQVERFGSADRLPGWGRPRRPAGLAEMDLLAGDRSAGPRFEEVTRPDGVDLLFVSAPAAAALAAARADPVRALLDAVGPYVAGVRGDVPPDTPVPVRIRVDPESQHDRFAYSVTRLQDGRPAGTRWSAGPGGPWFRLSVVRTEHVAVRAGLFFREPGARTLAGIVDYRERVVPFEDVPSAVTDHGEGLPGASLVSRPLTAEEIADVTLLAIGLVPWPPAQVFSDLNDYATILRYLHDGKDTLGRTLSGWDFAATCAGVLLPEVLEAVVRRVARLAAPGGDAAGRIATTFAAVEPADLTAVTSPLLDGGAR